MNFYYISEIKSRFSINIILLVLIFFQGQRMLGQVKLIDEVKISDGALHFDGKKVPESDRLTHRSTDKYDYAFGNRISPHGDCIQKYKEYIFMTWYKGGMSERNVMLTRYNTKTKTSVTIQFPHRHTGFQNNPGVGESHNTIAVGICPIDETIHLLYDMHAYSRNRPANGSLRNDYFRYSFSIKNAATLPDNQFTLDKFNPKQLYLKDGVNYEGLTYPNFFTNKKGELFVWIRNGGNNNGQYRFAKYNGNSWSNFTNFNEINARNKGINYNWGLYGDIKFEQGKMRIGFHARKNINNDIFRLNNGFYYAYSDDPEGKNDWFDHKGNSLSLPVIDPEKIKFSEPGDEVASSGANSVSITTGADWTVTNRGDIHFRSRVRGSNESKNVHTYKKAGTRDFKTSTNFPGGDLHSIGDDVYLIGLNGGRPFVQKAQGGTNNWESLYSINTGKKFRHGSVHIVDGILYYYLMQQASGGSAQPIYLQTYDLGVSDVLSISENSENLAINVYPNPTTNNTLTIRQNSSKNLSIALQDVNGKIFYETTSDKKNISLKNIEVSKGLYILRVQSDSDTLNYYKIIFQ